MTILYIDWLIYSSLSISQKYIDCFTASDFYDMYKSRLQKFSHHIIMVGRFFEKLASYYGKLRYTGELYFAKTKIILSRSIRTSKRQFSSCSGKVVLIQFLKNVFASEIFWTLLNWFSTLRKYLSAVLDHILSVIRSLATVSSAVLSLLNSLS